MQNASILLLRAVSSFLLRNLIFEGGWTLPNQLPGAQTEGMLPCLLWAGLC